MDPVLPGLYRHFKGNRYRVLFTARHSETEESLVIYHPEGKPESLWARPVAMFCEEVPGPDGPVARFTRLEE